MEGRWSGRANGIVVSRNLAMAVSECICMREITIIGRMRMVKKKDQGIIE